MDKHAFLGAATVGERGQIAIPALARRDYDLVPGDKILFFAAPSRLGILMIRAEELGALLDRLSEKTQSIQEILYNEINGALQ